MNTEQMPEKIYATPRGSGTVSGVWVDLKMDDEPRGEYEYVKAESVGKVYGIVETLLQSISDFTIEADYPKDNFVYLSSIEEEIQHLEEALSAAKPPLF